jgi:hypothetical protein
MDGVGACKREITEQVYKFVTLLEISLGHGTIANDGYIDILHLYFLKAGFVNNGIYLTHGQLATLYLSHTGCTWFGDVETEIGLAGYIANILHLDNLTQMDFASMDITQ